MIFREFYTGSDTDLIPEERQLLQVRFSQKGSKSLPEFTSENLKNIQLEDRCLAGGHF
jgi:hypothetical protein